MIGILPRLLLISMIGLLSPAVQAQAVVPADGAGMIEIARRADSGSDPGLTGRQNHKPDGRFPGPMTLLREGETRCRAMSSSTLPAPRINRFSPPAAAVPASCG